MVSITPHIIASIRQRDFFQQQLTGVGRPGALNVEGNRCVVRLRSDDGQWQYPTCFSPSRVGENLIKLRCLGEPGTSVCNGQGDLIAEACKMGSHSVFHAKQIFTVTARHGHYTDVDGCRLPIRVDIADTLIRVERFRAELHWPEARILLVRTTEYDGRLSGATGKFQKFSREAVAVVDALRANTQYA